jgi:outer membrane protein
VQLNTVVAGAAILVAAAVTVRSQNTAPKPILAAKVAVVAMRDAMLNTQDGRKAMGAMQGKFEPTRLELEKRQKDLQGLSEQLRRATTADAQQKLNAEIAAKKKTFDRDAEDLNNEVEQEDGKLMQQISQKMAGVIDEFAKKNGYTVVLDAAEPVMWASESSNVTPDVIRLYDQKFPVAGMAPLNTPAAPAKNPVAPPKSPAAPPKK